MSVELWDLLDGARGIIVKKDLAYVWHGGHTVNIYSTLTDKEIDMYSFGDFARDECTYDEFVDSLPPDRVDEDE